MIQKEKLGGNGRLAEWRTCGGKREINMVIVYNILKNFPFETILRAMKILQNEDCFVSQVINTQADNIFPVQSIFCTTMSHVTYNKQIVILNKYYSKYSYILKYVITFCQSTWTKPST